MREIKMSININLSNQQNKFIQMANRQSILQQESFNSKTRAVYQQSFAQPSSQTYQQCRNQHELEIQRKGNHIIDSYLTQLSRQAQVMFLLTFILQYLMNFPFNLTSAFNSPQEAAIYYNSLCLPFQSAYDLNLPSQNFFHSSPLNFAFYGELAQNFKHQPQNERPTDDMESVRPLNNLQVKVEAKQEDNHQQIQESRLYQSAFVKDQVQSPAQPQHHQKEKNLKKNTQSNIINNVFSYICSQPKSHRIASQLLQCTGDKLKIFYIFANNLKRINGKYLNRKNIKAICEIIPKETHFKMLSKSIKRLLLLPIIELRIVLRKLIFNYLRGSQSILPLLTSKKISKFSFHEHMNRRRDLTEFLKKNLKDYI